MLNLFKDTGLRFLWISIIAVVLDQWERLLLVEVQTPVDRLRGVVLALEHVAATHITDPRARIVARGGVVGAAVTANTAR